MDKQFEKLAYKLLVDILALALLSSFLILLAEGIVPGYVSSHLSFTRQIITIAALVTAISYVGRRNGIVFTQKALLPSGKNKITIFLAIISAALITNSLHLLGWFEISITAICTLLLLSLFFRALFSGTEK